MRRAKREELEEGEEEVVEEEEDARIKWEGGR